MRQLCHGRVLARFESCVLFPIFCSVSYPPFCFLSSVLFPIVRSVSFRPFCFQAPQPVHSKPQVLENYKAKVCHTAQTLNISLAPACRGTRTARCARRMCHRRHHTRRRSHCTSISAYHETSYDGGAASKALKANTCIPKLPSIMRS